MRMWFPSVARVAAIAAAAVIAGGAFAAPKNGPEGAADCLQKALVQFSIDDAQCSAMPVGSGAYNWCKTQAVQKYMSAIAVCVAEAPAAAVREQTRPLGVDGLQVAPQTSGPGRGKTGVPVTGGTTVK